MVTRSSDGINVNKIINEIYYLSGDGIRGFYKGYLITLGMSLPFNSIIWTLYWKIQSNLEKILPVTYDKIISPISSTTAALLTSLITQPVDVVKTRLQVAMKRQSIIHTCFILVQQRGFSGFFSGSIARASIIMPNSIIMMSLYEIIKRSSVKSKI